MKHFLSVLISLSMILCATAQVDSSEVGIHFEKGLAWQQVMDKAKSENKFIFVDCYTTWCLPCKKMEQNVYQLKEVGDFFNEKFISVKFQMDSSAKDNEMTRVRYGDANKIKIDYSVNGFPTYLVFAPDGRLLYRFEGMQDVNVFIKKAADAIDPKKNYYSFLEDYKKGERDYPKIALMVPTALALKDSTNAYALAGDYISRLKKEERFAKTNIDFIREFTRNSKEPGFKFIYQNSERVNKVMDEDDYAQKFIQRIVYKEYVAKALIKARQRSTNPDWSALSAVIKKQFGGYYAERVISSAKIPWYRKQNDFKQYTKYLVLYFNKYEFPNFDKFKFSSNSIEDLVLNNYAWEVFKYSSDRTELTKALAWSNQAVIKNPEANWIDTYANLIYKLGQNNLAIQWETIASQIDPNNGSIQNNLEKMKKGLPTWPEQKQ